MKEVLSSDIFILIILTTLWCFLHSALISMSVIRFLKKNLNSKFRYYRILYNLFALASFLLLVQYEMTVRQDIIFRWSDYFKVIQIVLLILSLIIFYLGAKQYSIYEFIGINQFINNKNNLTLTHSGEFNIAGIHKIVRHPWYLGTLIIIWLRDLSVSIIVMNLILSGYLIIGSYLEERKLVAEFGQSYKNYKKQVSMLIPFKWVKKLFSDN